MASAVEVKPELDHTTEKDVERRGSVARTEKGRWERLWPVIACGAGLFSDGYLNNVRQHPGDNKSQRSNKKICPKHHQNRNIMGSLDSLTLCLDYRTCKHYAQDHLSQIVCVVFGTGKCSEYNICWNGGGHVILRLHI